MTSRTRLVACFAVAAAVAACGGSDYSSPAVNPSPSPSPSPSPGGAPTIIIRGMAYSPLSLQVTPGAVVTVLNQDSMAHSVTSQSAPNSFRPGAVAGVSFDTGAFVGTGTFTIPANATSGTVVPYYCTTHLGTMATPNGEIRIVATPVAQTPVDPAAPASPY